MDKSKIIQQLMATFLEELEEHLRALNQDLLALEKDPPAAEQAERFKTLFRSAHSLKGAARSVNVQVIEKACHCLEDILTRVRDRGAPLGRELFALLFATVDAIEEAGMRLREQQDMADAPLAALLPRLEAAAANDLAPADDTAVPSEPPRPRESVRPAGAEPAVEITAAPSSVRVPAEKLDTLLARVGELLVARRRLDARLADLAALREFVDAWKAEWKPVERLAAHEHPVASGVGVLPGRMSAGVGARRAETVLRHNGDNLRQLDKTLERLALTLTRDSRLLDQVTRPLDDEVRRVRMLPFAEACAGLDRMVRDLAQASNKEVDLVIEGGSVELDRSILEGLKDPLRHLVRNSIDHGVEPAAERRAANKPPRGQIRVSAALRGAQVEVHVRDDGRGLDLEAIRAQARRRHLEEPADDRDLARLIFLPSFSTASIITDVSGRGVGLDVVKNRVESLHGTIDLSFEHRHGTGFTLIVPLTLTTLRAVLVSAGGQTYAFAGTNVYKMVHAPVGDIRSVAARQVLMIDGVPLPLASLAGVLNSLAPAVDAPAGKMAVIIIASGTTRQAFVVDGLLTEQEILIKSLGARIRRTPLVAGATLLPAGGIALVLNAANLVRRATQAGAPLTLLSKEAAAAPVRKRLLVVEDSVTTRTLMKSILEAAGYAVATAADGAAGRQFLLDHDVDLVVSDVDMPIMDGFELTAALRAAPKWRELPVVLVTARETERDKARGIEVGADAYIVKSAFDQRSLLETIRQIL